MSTHDDDHEHGPACGHTAVVHDDHDAHLVDGKLHCVLQDSKRDEEENDESNVVELQPRKILVQHHLTADIDCSASARLCEGHDGHKHGPYCGHEQVSHGDHFDYLVDSVLHHPHDDHCDHHTVITRKERNVEEEALIRHGYATESDTDSLGLGPILGLRRFALPRKGEKVPTKWYHDRDSLRFCAMFFLTGGYFFVELVYGLFVGSLALVADALHMLTDLIALCVGFYSLLTSRKAKTNNATFGMSRMEVVGGLMNGCFLMAIAFTIVLEAIERLADPDHNSDLVDNARPLIYVASAGLGINLIGLFVFGHGHAHGGHGHSHGGDGDGDGHGHSHGGEEKDGHDGHGKHGHGHGKAKKRRSKLPQIDNFNILAVFLHVMADALGSVAVIVSGLVIEFVKSWDNRVMMDALCSLVIACLVFMSAIPLVKATIQVLLQKVPRNFDIDALEKELLEVKGVEEIHELHIWQLNLAKVIGSLHVIMLKGTDFMEVSDAMKEVCHSYGIHSTSIQPEFAPQRHLSHFTPRHTRVESCHDRVCDAHDCEAKACCTVEAPAKPSGPSAIVVDVAED